uniref:Uncharacterized protein n=1 Tax=Knipowitschia caucasica TaxID=637954 RepID=A0AAV2M3W9_KNICA
MQRVRQAQGAGLRYDRPRELDSGTTGPESWTQVRQAQGAGLRYDRPRELDLDSSGFYWPRFNAGPTSVCESDCAPPLIALTFEDTRYGQL